MRFRQRRGFGRRFKPYGRKRTTRRLAKRVKRTERGIKRINKLIETKHFEIALNGFGISTPGAGMTIQPTTASGPVANFNVVSLCGIGGGTDYFQRIGKKVVLTSLNINMIIFGSSAAAAPSPDHMNGIRVMLIKIKDWAGGSTLNMARILDTTNVPSSAYSLYGQYNWDYKNNYRILYDKEFTLFDYANETGSVPQSKTISFTKKLRIPVTYSGTGNDFNAVVKNALFLVMLSTSTVAPYPTCYGSVRVKYQDV